MKSLGNDVIPSEWVTLLLCIFSLNLIIRKETLLDALSMAKFIRSKQCKTDGFGDEMLL